jgi:hypothetical protein
MQLEGEGAGKVLFSTSNTHPHPIFVSGVFLFFRRHFPSRLGMHRVRVYRGSLLPGDQMVNEVSNLLGTSLDIRRSEETNREYRASWVVSSFLLMSSSDLSKLITVLNPFATGNDRARDSRVAPGLDVCLLSTFNTKSIQIRFQRSQAVYLQF